MRPNLKLALAILVFIVVGSSLLAVNFQPVVQLASQVIEIKPCIGEASQGICLVTELTQLISQVDKSKRWTDTTGLVGQGILESLETSSSGTIPIYGMFVSDESINKSEASVLLGEKYGLKYPGKPAVTIVVLVDNNGQITGHLYNTWSESLASLNQTEALYNTYAEYEDFNTTGLISWVAAMSRDQRSILVQLPSEFPHLYPSGIASVMPEHIEISTPISAENFEVAKMTVGDSGWEQTGNLQQDGYQFWYEVPPAYAGGLL